MIRIVTGVGGLAVVVCQRQRACDWRQRSGGSDDDDLVMAMAMKYEDEDDGLLGVVLTAV